MHWTSLLFVILFSLAFVSCTDDKPVVSTHARQATKGASPEAASPIEVERSTAGKRATETASTIETERMSFLLPIGWEGTKPTSSMRVAQATIPGPTGPGEFAVFHFGAGQGGNVEANIERWIDQVILAEGTTAWREHFEANGFNITSVAIEGTLKPTRVGMGPSSAQPGWCLLGAVAEGPGGPWFFKATGPSATLSPQRDQFLTMLKSIQPK